jgi:hypothetical protein
VQAAIASADAPRHISCVDLSFLSWVIVDGRPRRVSEFAGVPPARRPRATCPVCGRRLTLKLGQIRRHHAAHAPTDRCAATRPETALHIDLKYHLAAELERSAASRAPLTIRLTCAGSGKSSCDERRVGEWLSAWDEVRVEARIDERRPDIVLRHAGRDVGAIEVLVSHAVDADKADVFAAGGIPWIEVRADAPLLDPDDPWTIHRPLPVLRDGTHGWWRCERHALEAQVPVLRAARVVDIYHPSGVRDRFIYRIDEWRLDGQPVRLTLRRDGREIATITTGKAQDSTRDAPASLRVAYSADVERLTSANGSFGDSPMRWASGDAAENIVDEAMSDMTLYDSTPLATRFPRRWFFARERQEWFLPRDTRSARWDRDEQDAFAPHPAWAASRAAVRERAAPSGNWTSFVFAARPTAEMFGQPASRITRDGPIAIIDLDADTESNGRCAIVVLTAAASNEAVSLVASRMDESNIGHVWVSHPLDWNADRAHLPWAAAGRNARGRGGVVIDGVGWYRAEEFARAFARGDRRVTPDAIRAHMAERVGRLRR